MMRKADRLAGGRLKDPKARGEWAELYFMMLAAGRGMKVSRPFGVARHDVGVDNPTRSLRVQVKSTIHWRPGHGYSLKLVGSRRKKYAPGTVDFFAILLIPVDQWYIIPFEVVGEMHCSLHFSPRNQRQKYGRYREAWHLLKENGLAIQACCDRSGPTWTRTQHISRCPRNDKIYLAGLAAGRLEFQLSATMSHTPSLRHAFTYFPRSARTVPSAWWMVMV